MELRPGYKQTEVGVIPEDWITQTIFQTSRKIQDYRGRTPKKLGMDWGGGDIPALSAGNVKMGFIDFNEECYLASEALYKRWMVNGDIEQHDIVFTMEAPLGNVALIPDNRKYILSQRTVLLQTNIEKTFSQFLYHVLMSQWFQRQLVENATGSTAQGIQRKKFEKLFVICPPLPEQRAIATALSDVDALLAKLDQLITKKRDLKQATMQQLLTCQTRLSGFSSNTKYKKTEVGFIPEDWKVLTMRASLHRGRLGGNYPNQEIESSKPLMKMGNIARGSVDLSKIEYIPENIKIELEHRLKSGDILFNTRNTIDLVGKVSIWRDELPEAYYNSNLMRLEFNPEVIASSAYANYVLNKQSSIARLRAIATGTTSVAAIYTRDLMQFLLPVPPKPEQIAIARVLSDMDAEITALETRRDKTCDLKQGMMQELLTGRIRLI